MRMPYRIDSNHAVCLQIFVHAAMAKVLNVAYPNWVYWLRMRCRCTWAWNFGPVTFDHGWWRYDRDLGMLMAWYARCCVQGIDTCADRPTRGWALADLVSFLVIWIRHFPVPSSQNFSLISAPVKHWFQCFSIFREKSANHIPIVCKMILMFFENFLNSEKCMQNLEFRMFWIVMELKFVVFCVINMLDIARRATPLCLPPSPLLYKVNLTSIGSVMVEFAYLCMLFIR